MLFRYLTLSLLLAATAFGQTADITGWSELRWGTSKASALKTLQPLGAHECTSKNRVACAEAPGADLIAIEKFTFSQIAFQVNLLFTAKDGLIKAVMSAVDKRGAFEKILADLTMRYGKPGLQSEYDGDEERTYTSWIWSKPHGKLSLESDDSTGLFTLTYEPRR